MILTALARLGKDAEVRHTENGDAVASLALAISYGRKGEDGYRPTQWIDASLWGKRAEALAPHLTKGKMVYVAVEEPHIEFYEGAKGPGAKIVGKVISIEFAGGREDSSSEPAQRSAHRPATRPAPQRSAPPADDSFDSDLPF